METAADHVQETSLPHTLVPKALTETGGQVSEEPKRGQLYYGDNLDVLQRHLPDESIDLIYLDPPFNSSATYNVLFSEQDGSRAPAQIKAFEDTWRWDQAAVAAYEQMVERGGAVSDVMRAFRTFLGPTNMTAYLSMMAPRLLEMHRVLQPKGSIFLHCDPTASHYLKMLMDAVFGKARFRNEIVWCYWGPSSPRQRQFSRKHDIVFWYSKGDEWTFNVDDVRIPYSDKTQQNYKAGLAGSGFEGADRAIHKKGKIPEDWWPIAIAPRSTKEYLGYPTQKPEALLERIIRAASNKNDVVLDPFCGCGTTVVEAQRLDRRWIGIDITHLAVGLMKYRLEQKFGTDVHDAYEVTGEPVDPSGAEKLAKDDPYQFQFWILGQVGARPVEEKKGPDEGIDGRKFFHERPGGDTKQVILSVKAGKTGPNHVRELIAVVKREGAQFGVLLTMKGPTAKMKSEAASEGFYESPWGKHPKIQLLTVQDLFDGKRIDMPPPGASTTFRKGARAKIEAGQAPSLFDDDADDEPPF